MTTPLEFAAWEDARVTPTLETLRLIPPDIFLSMMTQEIDMGDPQTCICGWALREGLAFGLTGESFGSYYTDYACQSLYGGSRQEWMMLFYADTRKVELALTLRLDEVTP